MSLVLGAYSGGKFREVKWSIPLKSCSTDEKVAALATFVTRNGSGSSGSGTSTTSTFAEFLRAMRQ